MPRDEMTPDEAMRTVRSSYPDAEPFREGHGLLGVAYRILTGRDKASLSGYFRTPQDAWLDAARRLNRRAA